MSLLSIYFQTLKPGLLQLPACTVGEEEYRDLFPCCPFQIININTTKHVFASAKTIDISSPLAIIAPCTASARMTRD